MNQKLFTTISILAIIFLGLFWYSSQISNKDTNTNISTNLKKSNQVKTINSQEFSELAQKENAFIIDVHTPQQTHIPGTNEFIPFDHIKENKNKLPDDKTIPIIVYCRSGNMSSQAASELVSMGYTNVYDLKGGTNAYKEQQVSVSLLPKKQALGTVIYGEVAKTSFILTNYTPLPIKITRVSTSCGCTKASVKKENLKAYESTVVDVTFDPSVHKDDTDLGDLTRTIYIETDNPNYPNLEATITATVIKK